MILIAIDPGPEMSAYVIYDAHNREVLAKQKLHNRSVLEMVREMSHRRWHVTSDEIPHLLVEFPECMGKIVSKSVFDTCYWAGRYVEAWRHETAQRMSRRAIKIHLTGKSTTGDPAVAFALRVRFGEPPAPRRPTKRLKGFADDMWAALAVAVTFAEKELGLPVRRRETQ